MTTAETSCSRPRTLTATALPESTRIRSTGDSSRRASPSSSASRWQMTLTPPSG